MIFAVLASAIMAHIVHWKLQREIRVLAKEQQTGTAVKKIYMKKQWC